MDLFQQRDPTRVCRGVARSWLHWFARFEPSIYLFGFGMFSGEAFLTSHPVAGGLLAIVGGFLTLIAA